MKIYIFLEKEVEKRFLQEKLFSRKDIIRKRNECLES